MAWHFLPDVSGPGTFNLGTLAQDSAKENPPYLYRALQAIATGAGTARMGGADVSPTLGLPIGAPFGGQFLPYVGEMTTNALNALNVYVPAGCTVSIAYEY